MSPENRKPRNSEPEDPITTRFTRAVLESTKGGKLIGWSKYKIQRVGSLMVATVSNSSDGVSSVYGQDEDHASKPGIMGIVLNPEGERSRQNMPKIILILTKGGHLWKSEWWRNWER